jgi:hypothetical protein
MPEGSTSDAVPATPHGKGQPARCLGSRPRLSDRGRLRRLVDVTSVTASPPERARRGPAGRGSYHAEAPADRAR